MSDRIVSAARKLVDGVEHAKFLKGMIYWGACQKLPDDDERLPCPFVKNKPYDAKLHPEEWCEPCQQNWRLRGKWGQVRRNCAAHMRALVSAVNADRKAACRP